MTAITAPTPRPFICSMKVTGVLLLMEVLAL